MQKALANKDVEERLRLHKPESNVIDSGPADSNNKHGETYRQKEAFSPLLFRHAIMLQYGAVRCGQEKEYVFVGKTQAVWTTFQIFPSCLYLSLSVSSLKSLDLP